MNTAKIFTNGRSQTVRLPKECRFDGDEVCIQNVGDMVILYPQRRTWDAFFKALDGFTDDFMTERRQPRKVDKRKRL